MHNPTFAIYSQITGRLLSMRQPIARTVDLYAAPGRRSEAFASLRGLGPGESAVLGEARVDREPSDPYEPRPEWIATANSRFRGEHGTGEGF